MVLDNVFGINRARREEHDTPNPLVRVCSAIARQLARLWCGIHGHLICSALCAAMKLKAGKSAGQ